MIVTDKQYGMDNFLVRKCQLYAQRISGNSKLDGLIIIDGDEGYGKTTLAVSVAYLVAYLTGREFPFDTSHLFFDVQALTDYAVHTKDQIIIWDEAALGGLSTEGYLKEQVKLLKLLMVARKKRHFYIFNIPKFYRLKEGIIDRALALIHVYAKNETELGRFVYYNKATKEAMYNAWRTSHKKQYRKFAKIKGKFSDHLAKIIDEVEYDRRKDIAILSIQADKESKTGKKFKEFKALVAGLTKKFNITDAQLADHFEVKASTISQWRTMVND